MKSVSFIGMIPLLCSVAAFSSEPVRISVTRFDEEAKHVYEDCKSYVFDDQYQLQTVMERELSRNGLKVLERRDIRRIHEDEHELPNSDQFTSTRKGRFLLAQYTVTGGISELGVCENSSETSLEIGGIASLLGGPDVDAGVGLHKIVSKVKVIAQLVSTETGEIVHSFLAGSEISDSGAGLHGEAMGIGAGHRARSTAPIERASNQAIADLASQIGGYLRTAAR